MSVEEGKCEHETRRRQPMLLAPQESIRIRPGASPCSCSWPLFSCAVFAHQARTGTGTTLCCFLFVSRASEHPPYVLEPHPAHARCPLFLWAVYCPPGKNPNWNQTLRFALSHPPYVLELELWDDDPGRDDFMAKGIVDFKTAVDYGQHSGSFPLRGKHGE